MTIRSTMFRLVSLLGVLGTIGVATITRADTRVCPPSSGVWGDSNLIQGIDTAQDCWIGETYETAIENVGRGKIMVGAGGGSVAREVWAYNFSSGPLHDYVRAIGYTTGGTQTCIAYDYTKNAAWGTPATGSACNSTNYGYIEGWHY